MKKLALLTVLVLGFARTASACDNPPCADTVQPAPCPEGETCAAPVADAPAAEPPGTVTMGPPQNIAPAAEVAPAPKPHTWVPEPATVAPFPSFAEPAKPKSPYRRKIGVQLGLGVPDAATLGVVFRPVKFVRVELGGAYNYLTEGVQVGVTALPFGRVLSFTGECGYFFGGNANKFTNKEYPALDDTSYEYCNTHAGLDFGRERATFFIHGGMSYFDARIRNTTQQINRNDVTVVSDPHLTAWFPSFKLGLIVYFGK